MNWKTVEWRGIAIIPAVFVISLAISVYHLWAHQAPLFATILGQGSLLALTFLFGVIGYHALTNAESSRERDVIGIRAGLGFGLAGLASIGYGVHQHLTPEAVLGIDALVFQATFVALVGGIAGAFVGLETARRTRTVTDLATATQELEATQADIRTEKQRFESLFMNSPAAVVDIRYSDGEPTIERANTAFIDLVEGENDIEGSSLFEVVPLQESATEQAVADLVGANEMYQGEVTIEWPDAHGHYKLRVIPYEVGKAGERAFALFTDVTELREIKRDLEETVAELDASNERLEQFAHAASHDLQEPLRMISNYLQLVDERYGEKLDTDGREFLDFATEGANRMQSMIDGLLEYARVDTAGEPFEPIDLQAVVDDARKDLEVKIDESDAQVIVGELPRVEGDGNQLRQVVQNLLENAIDYRGEEPPRIQIDAHEAADVDEWVISVSDNGIGIDPDDRDRIFDVFQRLHAREERDGIGLGLTLCKRIIERHGGELWVESEPGEGTTFYFTLHKPTGSDEAMDAIDTGPLT